MNRILLSIIVGCIISIHNIGYTQQSPVYASQAGAMQPYDSNNQGNNGYNNNGYGNGNPGYGNYNNQSYDGNNQQYGNNYNNDNQQNYNNNQQNNNWQNQYNNQYSGYNNNNPGVTNVSYNSNNGYNQQNNNKSRSQNNPFLVNYARKNKRFSATVYKMDKNGKLYRSQLDSKSLQKAIIIFFGDWCPHCAHFLTSFAKYINQLTSSGIKIIFIGVPSIERIQNWQTPTISDYNESKNKLQSFGINPEQLSQNAKSEHDQAKQQKKNKQQHNADILKLNMPAVELVLLGDNSVLDNNAIDSLPTMLAVNNSTEQFRGGADNSLDVVNFENPISMQQFQEIWYEDDEEEEDNEDEDTDDEEDHDDDEEEEDTKKKVKKKNKSKKDKKKTENSDKKNKTKTKTNEKKNNNKKSKNSKSSKESSNKQVDISLTNFHTRLLNRGCNCSCNMPQVVIKHVRVPVQAVQKPVQTQKVVYIPQSQVPVNTQTQQTTVVTSTISNSEVDEQFLEEEEEEPAPSKGKKCMRRNPRPLCNSRIKQKRAKIRERIETAIEKHENNRCNCN